MAERRDASIVALEAIYAALKNLEAVDRKKVLSSALALLGETAPTAEGQRPIQPPLQPTPTISARPVGLAELITDKRPGTNAQRIAMFAYYRERSEGLPRFGRTDLKPYFAKARLAPAGNYDRDFGEAVRAGWIHEDGSDSYLTTKGIEAIEAGFEGERKYSKGKKAKAPKKKVTKARKR
jgi:hypothetical protein